jgi:outer membrane lipoprotein SlyB
MNTYFRLPTFSLIILLSIFSLTACSQKPSSEEISAQVKTAMEQAEKDKQAAAALAAQPAPSPAVAQSVQTEPAPQKMTKKHATTQHYERATVESKHPVVCLNCGEVLAVNMVEVDGKGSGIGLVTGGVVGGLVGNQVGNGTGRDLATLAGVVGGAFAGNQIEKKTRKTRSYDIRVKMDDGTERTYRQPTDPDMVRGQQVKIENNMVVKN